MQSLAEQFIKKHNEVRGITQWFPYTELPNDVEFEVSMFYKLIEVLQIRGMPENKMVVIQNALDHAWSKTTKNIWDYNWCHQTIELVESIDRSTWLTSLEEVDLVLYALNILKDNDSSKATELIVCLIEMCDLYNCWDEVLLIGMFEVCDHDDD